MVNATDYAPFGMTEPGRSYSATNSYRYGFNGKENDNEVKGEGNEQDYGMRIYDTRLGRFLSVDPITSDYPNYSTYMFAGDKPIEAIDLDGLEEWMAKEGFAVKSRAQMEIRFPHYPGGEIRAYNPSWTEKWSNSHNIFGKLSYDIVNGFYTTGQQLTAGMRGSKYVYNLGGGAYDAHGGADENQRTQHFVDAAVTLIPGSQAENAGNKVLTKILQGKVANRIITQIEETVAKKLTSADFGKLIGWGEGQSAEAIQQTIKATEKLTSKAVSNWEREGLRKKWVQEQLNLYTKAIEKGGDKLKNNQLKPRRELMEKILKLWK